MQNMFSIHILLSVFCFAFFVLTSSGGREKGARSGGSNRKSGIKESWESKWESEHVICEPFGRNMQVAFLAFCAAHSVPCSPSWDVYYVHLRVYVFFMYVYYTIVNTLAICESKTRNLVCLQALKGKKWLYSISRFRNEVSLNSVILLTCLFLPLSAIFPPSLHRLAPSLIVLPCKSIKINISYLLLSLTTSSAFFVTFRSDWVKWGKFTNRCLRDFVEAHLSWVQLSLSKAKTSTLTLSLLWNWNCQHWLLLLFCASCETWICVSSAPPQPNLTLQRLFRSRAARFGLI